MESVSSGRSVALRGHPSGKLVGRTSGDYPGSQVQEGAVAGYLSHKHRNPQLPHLFFRLRTQWGWPPPQFQVLISHISGSGPDQLPSSL